jgi:hypothetical protein
LKKIYLLIYLLLYTLNHNLVFSAPVSGVGSFSFDKNKDSYFLSGFQFVVRADHQNNKLPTQSKQVLYKDPGSEEDARHYTKSRSSDNCADTAEFEAGASFFDNVYIYGKAGFGRFQSELFILDEIVVGLYQSPFAVKVTDNSLFTYGGGLSIKIFEKEVKSLFKYLNTHLDFQYRRFSIDTGGFGQKDISYDADFDEIQGAVVLSGSGENTRVFFGPRVSSITGNEKLIIKKTDFLYEGRLKTSKNIGWVFGINFFENDKYSISMQKRTGDEEGVSFEAQIKF